MDASTARTQNIRTLVEQAGGPTAWANAHPRWTQAQVSQWISIKSPKGIGHRLARRIETALNLPPGWMDHDHSGTENPAPRREATEMLALATPRSREALQGIIAAADAGTLTEADIDLLGTIAARLQKSPRDKKPASRKIRRKIKDEQRSVSG